MYGETFYGRHTAQHQNLHHFPPHSICYFLYGIGNSW